MTLLCGDPSFTGYSGIGPADTDGAYLSAAPFIAVSNGLVTSLNCWLTPGTANAFVMGLYDGVLQQLVYSAPVTVSSAGLTSFPIAPTPIRAYRAYQIILIAGPGTYQFGIDGSLLTRAFRASSSTYPAPPVQLSGPSPSVYGAPAFYADGDAQALPQLTSGTSGLTLFDTATLLQAAFNRCRIRSAVISDQMVSDAKRELYLFLSQLANGPTPLWAIDTQLLPFTAGLSGVQMPAGTVDVKNVNYRFMNPLQSSGTTTYSPSTATQVNTVAVTWNGPAVPLQIQMSQTGSAWTTLVTATPNASPGQTTFYDLDGAVAAPFWQVIPQAVPPGTTLQASNVAFYSTLFEVPMEPYSRDEWSQLPNRAFPGTPRQFWFERVEPSPVIHFWPAPQTQDQMQACAVVWRHRHIMDVGTLAERIECPQRWLPAIVDGLAEVLGRITPEVDLKLLPSLQGYAAASLKNARGEERENATTKIVPGIACYTR